MLDEAVARGESVRKTVDSVVAEYGQWIFAHVFGGDTTAVIDGHADNSLWCELTEVADGSELRLPAEPIERAALCAAYDQRLESYAWRALDFSRKSPLVRLARRIGPRASSAALRPRRSLSDAIHSRAALRIQRRNPPEGAANSVSSDGLQPLTRSAPWSRSAYTLYRTPSRNDGIGHIDRPRRRSTRTSRVAALTPFHRT